MHWLDTLLQLRAAGTPSVVVTVASTKGSAPREAGTKMIVSATDVHGTIGGGHLEHKAIAIARDQLAAAPLPPRRQPRPMLRRAREPAVRAGCDRRRVDRRACERAAGRCR